MSDDRAAFADRFRALAERHGFQPAALAAIALAGVLAYSNTFNASFQFDDFPNIVQNLVIRETLNLVDQFEQNPRRVVGTFTFALNYAVHELDVTGYHVVNLAIHLLGGFVVWSLVRLTLRTPNLRGSPLSEQAHWLPLAAAALFVLHPIQTQAVTYVVQRFASLSTLFYLTALACYARGRLEESDATRKRAFIGAGAAALLATFTKESAFTLPFAVLLYEYVFFAKSDWRALLKTKRAKILLVALGALALVIPAVFSFNLERIFGTREPQQGHTYSVDAISYLFTQFRVLVEYLRLLVAPYGQTLDYDYPLYESFFQAPVFLSFLFLAALAAAAAKYLRRFPLLSFGVLFFFLANAVESSVIPIPNLIFEHRVYLPFFGFAIFLPAALYRLLWRRSPVLVLGLLLASFAALGAATHARNEVWRTPYSLWNDCVEKAPGKARPWNNRGVYFLEEERYDEASADFNRAIEINPDFAQPLFNRGDIYVQKGMLERAESDYRRALALNPILAPALVGMGNVERERGNLQVALAYYNRAAKHERFPIKTYYNRSVVYRLLGDYDRALADCDSALTLRPDYKKALLNRGTILHTLGRNREALENLNALLRIDEDNAKGFANRAAVFFALGNDEWAERDLEKAIALDPEFVPARLNRAKLYLARNRRAEALSEYRAALALDSTNGAAWYDLGKLYEQEGLPREALARYDRAALHAPENADVFFARGSLLMDFKESAAAAADFTRVIALQPDRGGAYVNRAVNYYYMGKYREAARDVELARKFGAEPHPGFLDALERALR